METDFYYNFRALNDRERSYLMNASGNNYRRGGFPFYFDVGIKSFKGAGSKGRPVFGVCVLSVS